MKNLIYVVIAMLMVACGSNTSSNYEKTISEALLKGSSASDVNLKIIELKEQGTVTVADSIAYLTDVFRKDKQLIIDRVELAKKMTEDLQAKSTTKHNHEKYITDIAVMNNRIDSLKNLTPDNLQGYDSKNTKDVLAVIVRCKYSVAPGGTAVQEVFDFYLSPDGNKFYGKTRAK
ncbi:MAG: hypothetical protein AB7D46_07540 [Flavobacteriaceae bacterium]